MGEEICACIRLKEGEKTTAEEIKAFCKGKVGASIHPKHRCAAQFSNTLCLPTCQPTAHYDPTQLHALSPSGLQISHFKIPRYIVFVTNYPLTVSGKVCKETREGNWLKQNDLAKLKIKGQGNTLQSPRSHGKRMDKIGRAHV